MAGIGIGQRLQEHAVHYTENRRIRPDAERQDEYGDGRKPRILSQSPKPVADVLRQARQESALASNTRDGGLARRRALHGAQLPHQQFMAADFLEGDTAGIRIRNPGAPHFPVTIFGVLR
jgi:hypothetical protein